MLHYLEHFQGKVDSLNMENYNYGAKWKNGFIDWSTSNPMRSKSSSFALKASNATFTNMKFTNMVMLGNTAVATIVVKMKIVLMKILILKSCI